MDCCDLGCKCKCGESVAFIGAFIFVVAILFWIVGELFVVCVPYGPAWNGWFHPLNMWFFKLGAFLFVLGLVMAPLMRGKKAFSREPKEPLIQVDDGKCGGVNTEASAPIPYVMLPA
mmetsp:Transcript_59997/g.95265  ORF Transcript_59997/g.95265 Transcript_59997/m.95265 type:complete len:117 (+) Transcript_59997:75-425(+)